MSTPAQPLRNDPAVEAAFEAAPAEVVAEIVDGELHLHPRPAKRHTRAASRLAGELIGPFDRGRGGPGGWVVLIEPEFHLGSRPDKLVPDLAAWRRARLPDAIGEDEAHYEVAPDWACEVVSSSTERLDRGKKMRIYRREGVRHVWLVSPVAQTVEVYRLDDGKWTLLETYEGDARVRAEPFESLELDLGALWER